MERVSVCSRETWKNAYSRGNRLFLREPVSASLRLASSGTVPRPEHKARATQNSELNLFVQTQMAHCERHRERRGVPQPTRDCSPATSPRTRRHSRRSLFLCFIHFSGHSKFVFHPKTSILTFRTSSRICPTLLPERCSSSAR